MEHINIKEIENGYVKLIPDEGYMLLNILTNTIHSEAVVKNEPQELNKWKAVKVG